jgi:hypothetical protein
MFDSDSEDYDVISSTDKNIFVNSKNVEELKSNNIRYIKRDLKTTSYSESLPLISKSLEETLKALNEFDFITSKFKLGTPDFLYDGEKYYHTDNRSYIIGLINKEDYNFLKEEISIYYPSLHTIIYNDKQQKIYPVSINLQTKDFYDFYYIRPEANCSNFISCTDVYPELEEKYIEILVQDLEWNNREYLFNSLLNSMKKITF